MGIKPVTENTKSPGKYFEFTEDDAFKFFKIKPNYRNYGSKDQGKYKMMNSCGEVKDVWIYRNARNCDDTSNRLQCGRLGVSHEDKTSAKKGDWSYAHLQDPSSKRWVAIVKFGEEEAEDVAVGSDASTTTMFSEYILSFGFLAS